MAFDSHCQCYSIIIKAFICVLLVGVTRSYEDVYLSQQDVCKLEFDLGHIKLKSDGKSAVLIKDGDYFTSSSGRYDFSCKFVVKTKDKESGIYAVIQELNFRKNEDDSCKDYIEMSLSYNDITKLFTTARKNPKRFCGNMSPGMWLKPDDNNVDIDINNKEIAPNAYVAPSGELSVEIHIARERLQLRQRLVITLALTAYKRGCFGDTNACRPGECIDSSFMQDNIQNCPYVSCADEMGCASLRIPSEDDSTWHKDMVGSTIGTKVTFGAIAAIVMMILTFAVCLCLYKRKLCVPRPRRNLNLRPVIERTIPIIEASAPPIIEEIETKDLPPTYDSLYPSSQAQPNSQS